MATDRQIFDTGEDMEYKNPVSDDTTVTPAAATQNRNLGSLAEDVIYRAPGCSDLMVRKILQATWRDFAERACVVKHDFAAALVANQKEYELDIGTDATHGADWAARDYFIKSIECAWIKTQLSNGRVLTKRLFEAQDIMLDTVSTTQKVSLTVAPSVDDVAGGEVDGSLTVAAATLMVRFILLPKRGSENIPEAILDRYGTAIIHGTLAALYAMQNQPWSDSQQAQIEAGLYDKAVEDASEMTVFGDQIGNGRYVLQNQVDEIIGG